MKHDP